jgi:two-component system, cell cycle sensor histidine kinase and response regulator CckA
MDKKVDSQLKQDAPKNYPDISFKKMSSIGATPIAASLYTPFTVFDNMLNGFAYCQMIFEQDRPKDFVYLEVNSAFEALTGLKNVTGKRVSDIVPGIHESDPELLEIYGRVALTGSPERFETHVEALGMWFSIAVYSPYKGYFVAIFDVINNRKRMEKELAESERRYRELVELSPDAIFIQAEGKIAFINPAGVKLLGATRPEEVLGLPVLDMIHPDFKEIVGERTQVLWNEKTPVPPLEEQFLRMDGSIVDVEVAVASFVFQGKPGVQVMVRDITERKRAIQEIESLAKFPGENPSSVLRIDREGVILYANQSSHALLELWGCEIGQSLPYGMRQLALDSLDSKMIQEFEVKCGESIYALVLRPIADMGYVNIYGTDISERKRAEEALRRSEENYRLLVNQIPACVYKGYADGSVDFFDNKVEALTGYRKKDFDSRAVKWLDLIIPEDLELAKNKVWEALQTNRSYVREYRIRRKDGAIRWIQGRAKIFCNTAGKIDHLKGVLFDVTERRQSEQILKLLHHQNQLILDSAAEGILGLDIEGNHVFVNPAAAKMLGHEANDLIGSSCHSTWHYSKADGTPYSEEECSIHQTIKNGVGHYSEDFLWRKDGSGFPAEVRGNPIFEDGKVIGTVVTFWDITERKKLEAQFLQAQKMEAVGRLAGGVAHDFNNMLAVIMGYVEMMQLGLSAESPLHQQAAAIKKASERAASLTRQLLAFSRKQVQQAQVLNLNTVIGEMDKMLRRLIGEDIDLRLNMEPGLAAVKADPGQVEQILMNLVVNARDAMPLGGRITIETANVYLDEAYVRKHSYVTPGPYVVIAVSDDGAGMDAETKSHIFEPFFTTKEMGKGTGLGLSTVYGIVKQSQGSLEVYSEPGIGTTFKLYLPQVEVNVTKARAEALFNAGLQGTETILVVEDEEMLRELVCESLKRNGYEVLEANHGNGALAVCEGHQGPIHLLATDVVMPNLGGRELAERVAPMHPEMKVLFMSGYTKNVIIHHGALNNTMHFLEKPFTANILLKKVRALLDNPLKD